MIERSSEWEDYAELRREVEWARGKESDSRSWLKLGGVCRDLETGFRNEAVDNTGRPDLIERRVGAKRSRAAVGSEHRRDPGSQNQAPGRGMHDRQAWSDKRLRC